MDLNTAREWVRRGLRDGNDEGQYRNADVDRAIMYAGQHFARKTRSLRHAVAVTLAGGASTIDLTAAIAAGFRPERLLDITVTAPAQREPVRTTDYIALNATFADTPDASGPPQSIAFLDWVTCRVFPAADVAYTLQLRFWRPFTTFEPGTEDAVTLNVPDDLLPQVLADGAAGHLASPRLEKGQGNAPWQRFLAFCDEQRGTGDYGVRIHRRENPLIPRARREYLNPYAG